MSGYVNLGKLYIGCRLENLVREALDLDKIMQVATKRRVGSQRIGKGLGSTYFLDKGREES